MNDKVEVNTADEKVKPALREPQHGERGSRRCTMIQPNGQEGCGGRPTWCSHCRVWSNTCCQEYGTCQCS